VEDQDAPNESPLTIQTLIDLVGAEAFDDACRQAMSDPSDSIASDVPHEFSDRLWYDGIESMDERLMVAAELYRRMPCYANVMFWRYRDFDEPTRARMWGIYREFLDDRRDAVAEPIAYSLWVDYFEDATTVDRAWREVSGPQEPRRPRLARVISSSGPVPWPLKESLYEQLAIEGGWDEPLFWGLYGSCVDVYGSLERKPALRILRRLRPAVVDTPVLALLTRALESPDLPTDGGDRRSYVAELSRKA